MHTLRTYFLRTVYLCVILFALIGIVFVVVFFAIKFGWTNESGVVDPQSAEYAELYNQSKAIPDDGLSAAPLELAAVDNYSDYSVQELTERKSVLIGETDVIDTFIEDKQIQYCAILDTTRVAPALGWNLYRLYDNTYSNNLIGRIQLAAQQHLVIDTTEPDASCEVSLQTMETIEPPTEFDHLQWTQNEEWSTIVSAIQADAELINQVAGEVGIEARLLTTPLVVEQLRLFHTQRALYKQFFQPLTILASATKTSWGVMSIKEATAITIENNLTDVNSEYYLGEAYEEMLAFSSSDSASERYNRLTNEDDHYYNYLYGALYIKQLLTQWENAEYSIHDRPEIVATLYNIGFNGSLPKENPQVGGAAIAITGENYTFGSLGYEYYYSTIMMNEFPFVIQ